MWFSVPTGTQSFMWYCGTTNVMSLTNTTLSTNNLSVGGLMFRYQSSSQATTGNETLTISKILAGIITSTWTTAITLNLPTGSSVYNTLVALNLSTDWSIINTGTATGTVTVGTAGATGHSTYGNMAVAIGTSAAFRTAITGLNTATTYRMS